MFSQAIKVARVVHEEGLKVFWGAPRARLVIGPFAACAGCPGAAGGQPIPDIITKAAPTCLTPSKAAPGALLILRVLLQLQQVEFVSVASESV
jgi:hypothetical protein